MVETAAAEAIVLREATGEDLPAVLALYAQPGLDDGCVLDLECAREIHDSFSRYPNYRLFVACLGEGGPVIGSYALLVMHNLAHLGSPSAIAEDVVVDQQHRGRGVGRRLMEHARAMARAAGCYKLALSSNLKRTSAHAFYDALGFERHGISFVITP